MSPAEIVEKQLVAYNAHDAAAMTALFSEDAVMTDFKGNVIDRGRAAIRTRYAKLFADHPQNQAEVVRRIVVNGIVMDHERVTRTPGAAPLRGHRRLHRGDRADHRHGAGEMKRLKHAGVPIIG